MEKREGLSADCKLDPLLILAIAMGGREHPCDRCNHDRRECRGFPRLDGMDYTRDEAQEAAGKEGT